MDGIYRQLEDIIPGANKVVCLLGNETPRWLMTTPLAGKRVEDFLALSNHGDCVAIVLHSLPKSWLPLLLQIPPRPAVLWRCWGYELYGDRPRLLSHLFPHGLYMPHTASVVRASHRLVATARQSSLSAAKRHGRRVVKRTKQMIKSAMPLQRRPYQRIDYFASVAPMEFLLIREQHKWFPGAFTGLPYGAEGSTAVSDQAQSAMIPESLLIGNSATPTCNHIDVFSLISQNRCFDSFRIVVPLSYGKDWYRDEVITVGRELFGDRFHPITEFLDKDDYFKVIASCSHAIMAQFRQQAGANIRTLVAAGVKLAMHESSPLYQSLLCRGIEITRFDDLVREPVRFASPLPEYTRRSNALQISHAGESAVILTSTLNSLMDLWKVRTFGAHSVT